MAEEPDDLVLRILREVCSKLGEHDGRFDRLEGRFDRLDVRFDEIRGNVTYALGLGSMNEMKARDLDVRLEAEEARGKRADGRIEEIEQRLTRVEEKVD